MMATTAYAPSPSGNPYTSPVASAGPSPPQSYQQTQGAYATPTSQTPPSSNVSPTTYHSHLHVRQLRQPKQPLYIPAALRPTDMATPPTNIPNRPRAPDTPPASKDNSFDSGKSEVAALEEMGGVPIRGAAEESDLAKLRRGLSRAASEGLDDDLSDVTGPPSRAHWKPDASAVDCAVCHNTFTWYFRKHHCRKCGHVVCGEHMTHLVPLDQNARFHPDGQPGKACDRCWQEWRVVVKLRHSRANSIADSQSSAQGTAIPLGLAIPHHHHARDDLKVGSIARSMGMEWSTF